MDTMRVPTLALISVLSIGACGASVVDDDGASTSSAAVLQENGLKYNGLKYNGLKFSGMTFNGMGLGTGSSSATGSTLYNVRLEKTSLVGKLSSGTTVAGKGFVGATLVGVLENGKTVKVGIAEIRSTKDAEVLHYALKTWDAYGSRWVDACGAGEMAVPVAGIWRNDGSKATSTTDFTFACVDSSAIGKCVMLGYKPWSLADYHQACVRMIRADYCGDGTSYTQDGNAINVFDRLRIQQDDHTSYSGNWIFDAEWGPNGAVCISHVGRPAGADIPCSGQTFFCSSSSSRFRSGVLLKNWVRLPDQYQRTSTDSNNNNYNFQIDSR